MAPTRDIVTITVDSKSKSNFDLPAAVLRTKSTYINRLLTNKARLHSTAAPDTLSTLNLPNTTTCDFNDFVQYLYTGRILPLPHNRATYCIEYHARRLVKALALGIFLESSDYQQAALTELHGLAHNLAAPEQLVDAIFAATVTEKGHAARKLIVAVVAAKMGGRGRQVSQADAKAWSGLVIARGSRIRSSAFWGMFDEYCQRKGGDCRYPATIQEAMA